MEEQDKSYGQIAYEAYCKAVDWKAVSGAQLPSWDGQCERLKNAWMKAGEKVVQAFIES